MPPTHPLRKKVKLSPGARPAWCHSPLVRGLRAQYKFSRNLFGKSHFKWLHALDHVLKFQKLGWLRAGGGRKERPRALLLRASTGWYRLSILYPTIPASLGCMRLCEHLIVYFSSFYEDGNFRRADMIISWYFPVYTDATCTVKLKHTDKARTWRIQKGETQRATLRHGPCIAYLNRKRSHCVCQVPVILVPYNERMTSKQNGADEWLQHNLWGTPPLRSQPWMV